MIRKLFATIPLTLPEDRIWKRLGYHRYRTEVPKTQAEHFKSLIFEGHWLCEPRGVYAALTIETMDSDQIHLEEGVSMNSASLSQLLEGASHLLCLAATIGEELPQERDKALHDGNATKASIWDAVGSEEADATLGWIQTFAQGDLRRSGLQVGSQRYSPGYGDLALSAQAPLFDLLNLSELGLSLTQRCLLIPEKSVIGLVPIWTQTT